MKFKLSLYHSCPQPLRSVAASAWGYYLRSWRYGSETDLLVEQAAEREQWNTRQWDEWMREALVRLLHRAATQVPYYADHWAARKKKGDRSSWQNIENWPILAKDSLRQNPNAFIARDRQSKRMFRVNTSGTTGKPVSLWRSRETSRAWYALFEARVRRWNDVSRRTRWANIGGQLVVPVNNRRPPFWVWNSALRQLYLSSYHLSPDLIPHYVRALQAYRIECLLGYSSSLYALASNMVRSKQTLPMRVVITNAEPLFDYQRPVIEAAFQCPVRETYGMAEIATAASECPAGKLHAWPDAGYIEILRAGLPVGEGERGDVIATGLLNADMPLIRYATGDSVRRESESVACACGRTLPLMNQIEGRTDDMLYTADGRQVGRLDPVFKTDLKIYEAQVIQDSLERLKVRYVPMPGFSASDELSIVRGIRDRMGNVQVEMEAVERIEREANGKFRAVICRLSHRHG